MKRSNLRDMPIRLFIWENHKQMQFVLNLLFAPKRTLQLFFRHWKGRMLTARGPPVTGSLRLVETANSCLLFNGCRYIGTVSQVLFKASPGSIDFVIKYSVFRDLRFSRICSDEEMAGFKDVSDVKLITDTTSSPWTHISSYYDSARKSRSSSLQHLIRGYLFGKIEVIRIAESDLGANLHHSTSTESNMVHVSVTKRR